MTRAFQSFKDNLAEWVNQVPRTKRGEVLEERREAVERIILCYVEQLKNLDLSQLKLSLLPKEIAQLTSLESINLSYNKLSEIPEEIGYLTSLKDINAIRNDIKSVHPRIGEVRSLEKIDLSNNSIAELPMEMSQLEHLHTLNLFHNNIVIVPHAIERLTALKKLNLSSNPILRIPDWLKAREESGQFQLIVDNRINSAPLDDEQVRNIRNQLITMRRNTEGDQPSNFTRFSAVSDERAEANLNNSNLGRKRKADHLEDDHSQEVPSKSIRVSKKPINLLRDNLSQKDSSDRTGSSR